MSISRPFHRLAGAALALALLVAPLATPVRADEPAAEEIKRVPILWEVQTKPTIYLFGTIHVADERVTTHPEVVKKALEKSQALYTELDFHNLDPAAMAKHLMIPEGKTLKDIASEATMKKFEHIVARYEISPMQVMQFQRIRPWMTAVQVPILVSTKRKAEAAAKAAKEADKDDAADEEPAQPDPMANLALDLRLYVGAKQGGKLVGGLEKPEEQFSIFNEITMEDQVTMLDESLDEIIKLDTADDGEGDGKDGKESVDPIEGLIRMYLAGDTDTFYEFMKASMGEDEKMQGFMEKLLDRRNIVMVRRMLEAAEKHPDKPMFVAVGAGHYPGPMGIIKLLEQTGYRVRPLHSVEAMDKPWPKMGAANETSSRARPCPPQPRCRRFFFGRRY